MKTSPMRLAIKATDTLYRSAMRAERTVRPAKRLKVSAGGFFVMKRGVGEIGHGSIPLSRLCPHRSLCKGIIPVIWVESLKEVYDIVVDSISRYPRQKAVQALLTNRCGDFVTFHVVNNACASSSMLPLEDFTTVFPDINYNEQRIMATDTLSQVVKRENISLEHYEALTLDVEGAEKLVLEGAMDILSRFRYVKCEIADFPARTGTPTVDELDSLLFTAGFKELGRRSFTNGPNNQGTAWDIVWKRVDTSEHLPQSGDRSPLVFDPLEVEAIEKCE